MRTLIYYVLRCAAAVRAMIGILDGSDMDTVLFFNSNKAPK